MDIFEDHGASASCVAALMGGAYAYRVACAEDVILAREKRPSMTLLAALILRLLRGAHFRVHGRPVEAETPGFRVARECLRCVWYVEGAVVAPDYV